MEQQSSTELHQSGGTQLSPAWEPLSAPSTDWRRVGSGCSLIQSPTMASKSAQFFMSGTNKQFEFVYSKYQEALQAKADSKNSKSEVLLKLDKW